MNIVNLYDILNIKKTATHKEIKKAYKTLILKCHPDKGGSQVEFDLLTTAYTILKNETEREAYDKLCIEEATVKVKNDIENMKEKNKMFVKELNEKCSKEDAEKMFENHMKEMNKKHEKTDKKKDILKDLNDLISTREEQLKNVSSKEAEIEFKDFVKKMEGKCELKNENECVNDNKITDLISYTGDFLPWNNNNKYGKFDDYGSVCDEDMVDYNCNYGLL